MSHPFPLPGSRESEWTAKEHQQAANHYWYNIMGVDRDEPNYRPYLTMMETAFDRHYAKAVAMRKYSK